LRRAERAEAGTVSKSKASGEPDPRDLRIAQLEEQIARLRAELARVRRHRSAYAGRRQSSIALGTWEPFAASGPVRDHIRSVMAETGITANALAKVAGVEWLTVGAVLDGTRDVIRTVSAGKLTAVTAEAVLASADDARVDATGTRRRLQALAVQGWSLREVSRRSGVDHNVLCLVRSGKKDMVALKTRRTVAGVYEAIRTAEPPHGTGGERTAAGRNRSLAQQMGWPSHWAWDDESIDTPDARPAEGWQRPLERRNRPSALLASEASDLSRLGLDRNSAADRLGVTRAALDKALERAARTAGEPGAVA
jgi:hypothetical protein